MIFLILLFSVPFIYWKTRKPPPQEQEPMELDILYTKILMIHIEEEDGHEFYINAVNYIKNKQYQKALDEMNELACFTDNMEIYDVITDLKKQIAQKEE